MRIIQAQEVSEEVKQLQLEKAGLMDELHRLRTSVREKQETLVDLVRREKAFQDSFMGNAEGLRRISELRKQYVVEADRYNSIIGERREIESEIPKLVKSMADVKVSITMFRKEKVALEDDIKRAQQQVEDIEKKNQRKVIEQASILNEIVNLHEEKAKLEEHIKEKTDEMDARERMLSQKELNLKVYEDRLIREYAVIFPDIRLKP